MMLTKWATSGILFSKRTLLYNNSCKHSKEILLDIFGNVLLSNYWKMDSKIKKEYQFCIYKYYL